LLNRARRCMSRGSKRFEHSDYDDAP
jgi:hypothetical protein